jgi:GAF domain
LAAPPAGASDAIVLSLAPPEPRPARTPPRELTADRTADRTAALMADLTTAAELCTALSRLDSAAALPDMLARAATLLDASGVIVWMAAGHELLAAASHGYDPRVISRLGGIPRDAENATAAAWRTGEVRTVPGDVMANGAIVAPMFAPDTCIGVLAAEVRHGREHDRAAQALTTMVAAQLATVLGAWPAAPQAQAVEA